MYGGNMPELNRDVRLFLAALADEEILKMEKPDWSVVLCQQCGESLEENGSWLSEDKKTVVCIDCALPLGDQNDK
jgi:formylmethanofuran dehydrogenase subunit E